MHYSVSKHRRARTACHNTFARAQPGQAAQTTCPATWHAQAALDKLPGELKAQQANAAVVERRLQCEKGSWVLEGQPARIVLPREFAQVGDGLAACMQQLFTARIVRCCAGGAVP